MSHTNSRTVNPYLGIPDIPSRTPTSEDAEIHQSLRHNEGPSTQDIIGESRATFHSNESSYRTSTQIENPEAAISNHEPNNGRLSENAVAIPSVLPRRTPVDEYYERRERREARELYPSDNIELAGYPKPTQNLPGTHLNGISGHAGVNSRQRSLTPDEGSRQGDASSNASDRIQSRGSPGRLVDLGIQLNEFEYDPIESSDAVDEGYPPIDFKPFSIRSWFLILTIIFFLACIGGIATLIWYGHHNTSSFHVHTSKNHLAYRYVPAAIGTLTAIWWRTIVTSLARMTPYISMAAQATFGEDGHRIHRTLQNTYGNTVFDPMNIAAVAKNRHWLLFTCIVIQLLMMRFIVPLKASFLQIVADDQGWTIIVHREIGYSLISIYTTLILATILMLVRLWNRDTGVKWDPVSVADQLALVQGSNILGIFHGLDFATTSESIDILKARGSAFGPVRLGYWRHRRNRNIIWHGLACIPPQPDSKEWGIYQRLQHQVRHIIASDANGDGAEKETPLDFRPQHVPNPEKYRYRHVMFFLNDLPLAVYALVLVVVIALSIVGLIDRRVQNGFNATFAAYTFNTADPELEVLENLKHTLLYGFLPVFLMSSYSSLWISADLFYRITEPFAGMIEATTAKWNVLLDYPSCAPGLVSLKAAMNGHWRVALFSTLSLIATAPPIIATGLFVATPTPTGYYVSIEPLNFWASFVILIIYLFVLIMARPTSGYRLPRPVRTITDVLSYCYASRILDDRDLDNKPIFSAQEMDDERVHLESRIYLAKKKYEFGMYLGKDGKRHIGFDVSARKDEDGREVRVTNFDPGVGIYGLFRWRQPRVLHDGP